MVLGSRAIRCKIQISVESRNYYTIGQVMAEPDYLRALLLSSKRPKTQERLSPSLKRRSPQIPPKSRAWQQRFLMRAAA